MFFFVKNLVLWFSIYSVLWIWSSDPVRILKLLEKSNQFSYFRSDSFRFQCRDYLLSMYYHYFSDLCEGGCVGVPAVRSTVHSAVRAEGCSVSTCSHCLSQDKLRRGWANQMQHNDKLKPCCPRISLLVPRKLLNPQTNLNNAIFC